MFSDHEYDRVDGDILVLLSFAMLLKTKNIVSIYSTNQATKA